MNIKLSSIASLTLSLTACTIEEQPTIYTCTNAQTKPVTSRSELATVYLTNDQQGAVIGFDANNSFYKHNECGPSTYSNDNGLITFAFYQYGHLSGQNNHSLIGYGTHIQKIDFGFSNGFEAITGIFENSGNGHQKEFISKSTEVDGNAWVTRKEWSPSGATPVAIANNKTKHNIPTTSLEQYFPALSYSTDHYVVLRDNDVLKSKFFDENSQTFTCQYTSINGNVQKFREVTDCNGQIELSADIYSAGKPLDVSEYFSALKSSPSFNTEKGRFCRDMNRFGVVCDDRGIK
ncbi:hypothetical protein VME0621_04059 [Vibrio mediterranei]|jgi:hypothetical protein|uniref:hypothetical protein n=1 Tax=Vibrio mediterranei TaxID=689 RepID=UPI000781C68F|nr:hypothetical protein [Vibrio mediterranei]SBO11923.1 hypothetical protein VME0621_04059 [Vibrio mediterranei]